MRQKKQFRSDHIHMPENHMEKIYSSENPLVRYVHNKRLWRIVEHVPKIRELSILDAGCGEGQLLERLRMKDSSFVLYGVDVTPIAIQYAEKRCPHATITLQDLGNMNFSNNIFDIITCTEVIEHIPHYVDVLNEFTRILKPKGLLILTFPNESVWTLSRMILGRKPWKVPDHVNSFTPKMICKLLREFVVLRVESVPFKNFPFSVSLGAIMVLQKNGA